MLMWLREICSGVRGNSGAGRRRGIGLHGEAAWFEDLGDPEAVLTDVKLLVGGRQVDLCLDREEENTALDWDELFIHLHGRVPGWSPRLRGSSETRISAPIWSVSSRSPRLVITSSIIPLGSGSAF